MKKVMVIGSGGAGKSTFSRQLSKITGLPLIHLDQLYFKPNWLETPEDEWKEKIARITEGDAWIIDGNYGGTIEVRLENCDTVIFFDLPRLVCVYRVIKRIFIYRKNRRPDMAEGCDEKFDWQFIKWVWNYPKYSKPKIENLLKQYENARTIVRLKSQNDVERFLLKQ